MAKGNLKKIIEQTVYEALGILRVSGVSVEVYLASDEAIHALNLTWRKKDKPTNVLSFESPKGVPHPETNLRPIGEIYLAPEYITNHNEDIKKILIHGLLHLLGYDHIKSSDAKKMERVEEAIFKKMGL